jgi:hypothetical protein
MSHDKQDAVEEGGMSSAEVDYLDWMYGQKADRPKGPDDQHYISLGAGVQSSTLALMAAAGEVTPMPAGAIFADTMAEPKAVYDWLGWLEKQLPYPVHRVSKGDLRAAALTPRADARGVIYYKTAIPFHTMSESGKAGRIPHRTCTLDYKIKPITKELRRLAKVKRGSKTPCATSWIGISLDELGRMRPAREPWVATRWPLIENRMTRAGCLEWMRSRGFPEPPRSACVFCPFKSRAEWRRLANEAPADFADAAAFDAEARALRSGAAGMRSTPYVHRALKPLAEVDLRDDSDRGQLSLWDDECSGVCGV